MVFFYMFPLEIEQKSVYNQRKLVFFYMFPLIIEKYRCWQNRGKKITLHDKTVTAYSVLL